MEQFINFISTWKDVGWAGVLILLVAFIVRRLFDVILDNLGVNIKRGHSREDVMSEQLLKLGQDVDALDKKITRLEQVYKYVYQISHQAADGIEKELTQNNTMTAPVEFFIIQLRTIQGIR